MWSRSYPEKVEGTIQIFYKIRFILEELYVAVMWIISQLITYIDQMNAAHVKISFNLKKNIYLSSRFRNIQHCTNIFHHHHMCHDHCIPYSCCTELIMCEVIRKLLEYINSWKMLFRFMSAPSCSNIYSIQEVELSKPITFWKYIELQKCIIISLLPYHSSLRVFSMSTENSMKKWRWIIIVKFYADSKKVSKKNLHRPSSKLKM